MARIALLCPDLLFGSKVEGALKVAGHSVSRFDDEARLREGISFRDLLVVDLTTDQDRRAGGGGVDARATASSARTHARLLLARRPGDAQARGGRRA